MDAKALSGLFKKTTLLNPTQIKNLCELILSYDESVDLAYEIIGTLNAGTSYAAVKADLRKERFGWDACSYVDFRKKREFRDTILAKPPEIREGEIECPKCHHKKTLVVEMQTRSADEGYTYYIHCFNPKCKAITK